MAETAAEALDRELIDWPLIEDWSGGGRYVEVIVPARRWLEWVVRRGPDVDAARAGAVLLAAGGVPASSRRALAERFPPRRGVAGGGEP
jgi:hypothetical protein